METVWQMRQVPLHSGKVRKDATLGLIYGHICIPRPLKSHAGSTGKKSSYRDKVLVHYFKDKNCINVLEIKLSSPNSHVMNDNGIN